MELTLMSTTDDQEVTTTLLELEAGVYVVNAESAYWVGPFEHTAAAAAYLADTGVWANDRIVTISRPEPTRT